MGGARDIEAGRAFIRVSVKENLAGLKAISNKLKTWGAGISKVGAGMAGLGTAVLAPLAGMAKSFADAGSAVSDMAARTGVSAERLQALGYAASMTGASMEDVERAIRRMQQNGFSADQMGAIADKMAAMSDPAERTAYAMQVFGKSGAMLIPMLSGGAAGLEEFREKAERMGIVMSSDDAAAADVLGDAIDDVTMSLKGVTMQIGAALAPALTAMATTVMDMISRIIAWVKVNRPLVVTIAKVAAVVTAAGGALMGIGGVLAATGLAMSGLATVIGVVLSPLGLLVAALAAGTAALFTFTDAGTWLKDTFSADFGAAFDSIRQMITGVTDALKAGEFQLAGEIAMTGLKLAFFEATKSIRTKWIEFNNALVGAMVAAADAILGIVNKVAIKINDAFGGMQVAWRDFRDWWEGVEYVAGRDDDIYAARNAAAGSINKTMGAWKETLDEFGNVMDENLNQQLADGQDRIAALREELARLTVEAGDKTAGIPRPGATKPEDIAGDIRAGMASAGITGTFSAHAAMAAFAGGGDQWEKRTEENTRQAARSLRTIERFVINGPESSSTGVFQGP